MYFLSNLGNNQFNVNSKKVFYTNNFLNSEEDEKVIKNEIRLIDKTELEKNSMFKESNHRRGFLCRRVE